MADIEIPIRYLRYRGGNSDKFYVGASKHLFMDKCLVGYGRWPNGFSWIVYSFDDGYSKINEKLRKGYEEVGFREFAYTLIPARLSTKLIDVFGEGYLNEKGWWIIPDTATTGAPATEFIHDEIEEELARRRLEAYGDW